MINWEKKLKRGNKLLVTGSKEKVLEERVKVLKKEFERTRKKLVKTEMIVELQKKIMPAGVGTGGGEIISVGDKRIMMVEMITERSREEGCILDKYEMCDSLRMPRQQTTG